MTLRAVLDLNCLLSDLRLSGHKGSDSRLVLNSKTVFLQGTLRVRNVKEREILEVVVIC